MSRMICEKIMCRAVWGSVVPAWLMAMTAVVVIGAAGGYVRAEEPGRIWTEPVTGMVFVWVPVGCFPLGAGPWVQLASGDEEEHHKGEIPADELPVHEVCLNGFWMGRTEVTQGQWRRIMGNNPSAFASSDNHPVDSVSWDDTQAFLQAMDRLGAQRFRLPTEAEWEYACRSGGRPENFPGGAPMERTAWFGSKSGESTHPVGTLPGNGLDLRDMAGNLYEWCEDVYSAEAYAAHGRNNPLITGGSRFRVMRGGAWISSGSNELRCGIRYYSVPDDRYKTTGFRVVRWR